MVQWLTADTKSEVVMKSTFEKAMAAVKIGQLRTLDGRSCITAGFIVETSQMPHQIYYIDSAFNWAPIYELKSSDLAADINTDECFCLEIPPYDNPKLQRRSKLRERFKKFNATLGVNDGQVTRVYSIDGDIYSTIADSEEFVMPPTDEIFADLAKGIDKLSMEISPYRRFFDLARRFYLGKFSRWSFEKYRTLFNLIISKIGVDTLTELGDIITNLFSENIFSPEEELKLKTAIKKFKNNNQLVLMELMVVLNKLDVTGLEEVVSTFNKAAGRAMYRERQKQKRER